MPRTAEAALLVEVVVEGGGWDAAGLAALANRAAAAALAELSLRPEGFLIALLAADDLRVAALNADFRGRPQPTNVLSWPSAERGGEGSAPPEPPVPGTADDPAELGDIALAWETCTREATDAGKPLGDHLAHLIVHAVLHLLGYDHGDDAEAAVMEAIEVRALARIGVSDPY